MTPFEDGPPREALVAQIDALKAVVGRQKRLIDSMRASHFWKLRDAFFAFRRRFGNGIEPLPQPTVEDIAMERAAFGEPYQLFRIREGLSPAKLVWLRRFARSISFRETIDVVVDMSTGNTAAVSATMASLNDQVYPFWHVTSLDRENAEHPQNPSYALCALDAGDLLEPDALLSIAFELSDGADVVYTDEDCLDAGGIPRNPSFKPGWSPETALTRDYIGRLCAIRNVALAAAGGLDRSHGPAAWYDAVLRVTETSDRVAHVPRVLVHRRHGGAPASPAEIEPAVRSALARRRETAEVRATSAGVDIRYAVPAEERVSVIVPTRDRADLLERCLRTLFERTDHPSFDVLVVDNGSREPATHELFERWAGRLSGRFRVIEDPASFNYSRLNNAGVAAVDSPYVVLLNNDTEVIARDWMSAMLGQARRASIGAVGALLLYEDGTVQHAGVVLGGVVDLAGHVYRFLDPTQLADDERLVLDTNYLAVTGACLMVSRSKYQEVGGLDESLAVSYNDIDFCLKLFSTGYRNVMVPRARLFHYESKSRGRDDTRQKFAIAQSEADTIRLRWPEWARRDPYYNPNLTLDAEDFSLRTSR